LFLIGGGVKGGIYGNAPDLGNLDEGNLRFTTDFRSVYATVLERWLGRPSAPVLAGSFASLPILS
ncbi:MAG: Twin-arginine translocation pathway signal sequence domain-containing protein, partial [Candidatus Eremiobacteraeota bacterium]|nr:Twin-arginine translocation pathway signal sequence domain-containing protein [Candidatus Eremiobacteraeota bacterium]